MKNAIRKNLAGFSGLFALKPLIRLSGQKLLLPFYHTVNDETPVYAKHLYRVKTIDEFKTDLAFLLKYFKPISLEGLVSHVNDKKRNENVFHLSFDDGLKECHDIITPILQEKGIPASFFINTDFIDNKQLFYRYKVSILIEHFLKHQTDNAWIYKLNDLWKCRYSDGKQIIQHLLSLRFDHTKQVDETAKVLGVSFDDYLKNECPYMSRKEIKTLADRGFTIGSHGSNHAELQSLDLEGQIMQIQESTDFITQAFHQQIRAFSFPFTDHMLSNSLFDKIYNPTKPILDVSFGTAGMKHDVVTNHLQRIPMEVFPVDVIKKIKSDYLYFLLKKIANKNQIRRS